MFLFHTIELTHCNRHERPIQIMSMQVPVFQAAPYVLRMSYTNRVNTSSYLEGASKVG